MQFYGDSITAGFSASPSSLSYVSRSTPVNYGVSGYQAADVSNLIITKPDAYNYSLMIGTNDVCVYKNDPTKKQYYEVFLRHCLAWMAFPSKIFAKNMVTTGSWVNTQANNFGKNTTEQGATISCNITGEKVFIGYIIQNHQVALSAGDVYIDNILVGTLSCDGITVSMNTQNGSTYANACKVFHVENGNHEVKIVCTTSGKQLYINYVCSDQPERPVKVANIIKMKDAGYSAYGVSVQTINDYNAIISNVLQDFGAELIDNYSKIEPNIHLADNLHPNNLGHEVIYKNMAI
jgi:hypothetical protein